MRPFGSIITTLFVFIIILIAVFIINPNSKASSHNSAKIQSNKLVKIETRSGVTQKFIIIKPSDPVASVILFTGGKGKIGLESFSGKPTVKSKGIFAKAREDFARNDLIVALVHAPSDQQQKFGMNKILKENNEPFRVSNKHVQDIKAISSYLKNEANIPIWLVGHSMGTFSASNGAIHIKDGVDGLVLLSSVTRKPPKWKTFKAYPNGILTMGFDKITVPTLIAFHKDDKCPGSPAMDAPEIKKALVNSPAVEVVYFSGGKKPGPEPCHWKATHGFYGIENQVVSAIVDFIKSNSK